MKKTDWQYLVDTLLFLCIVGIAIIGFLMGLVIPKGPAASETSKYFLGLHRHQWGNIHFYLSIAFVTLVIIHLLLSWKWIKGKSRQIFKKGWGTMLILTACVSLLIIVLFWALYPKVPGAYEDYGVGAGKKQQRLLKEDYATGKGLVSPEEDYILITGQMTLQEVEEATGIPAKKLAAELGLPSRVSLDETLGQLRKKYPFTLQEVRDVLSVLLKKEKAVAEEKKEIPKIRKEEKHEERQTEEHEEKITRGRKAEDQSGILITGRMTLYDLEEETGIPAHKIANKLGLPANAPLDETLGRLRKRYLFTMQEVRDIVVSLMKKAE
ncbi:hypothetical protein AMJ44_01670 [candidate division WOR-1 bacterium DG_54_3]|uniref:Flavinylation-associated cytochrome domain-containing protein n=1 Tax=candidate division WOR-1 bacterium DG_54_3 TaxID=1703775 RepID=A0A0S7Y565_UNCSA|nr:MAG: hypothetical protein AMJ44_01670 [candidate division WOR-1 bacterium DG_54_3]